VKKRIQAAIVANFAPHENGAICVVDAVRVKYRLAEVLMLIRNFFVIEGSKS